MELDEMLRQDVLDSRDVIARIEELEDDEERGMQEEGELFTLQQFANESAGYAPDWHHGETLIADSYFEEYARQLADDIGAVDSDASWPASYIDWKAAAEALQMDYTAVELDGMTFWTR